MASHVTKYGMYITYVYIYIVYPSSIFLSLYPRDLEAFIASIVYGCIFKIFVLIEKWWSPIEHVRLFVWLVVGIRSIKPLL